MATRRRIVYVDLAPGVGGSLISLSLLVTNLDRARFEPVVVLVAGQPYAQRFGEMGVRVLTVPGRSGLIAPGPEAPLVAQARQSALAGWLRQGRRRTALLHTAGFLVKNLPPALVTARTLQIIFRQERPDLAHLNDAVPLARSGILAAGWAGVPCLAHVRAFTPLNAFDRRLARRVDGYIFISRATADFQAAQGVRARASWVVPNGLDLAAFADLPAPERARRELSLPTGPLVGAVGRVVAWKGHDVFLRALALLAPEWPRLHGVIVGAPEKHDPRPLEELQALIRELDLGERVILTGYRPDVPRVLAALDVLVHSAVEPEPFGRVIIEGLAARVPVAGARAGAVPEIIQEGETGLLFPPGDPAALARTLDRLLRDRPLARRLAEAGRQRVERLYTAQGTARAVESVYEEVLCRR